MNWLITKETAGKEIKAFLKHEGRFSKRLIIKAKSEGGKILVNNEKKTVRYILQENDILEVILPPEKPAARMKAENISLDIVYEDAQILVVNKPAGIATIPSRHHPSGTIANGLLYYYKTNKIKATVHVVTRLDKDTSGLMLIAKSQHCHSLLSLAQREYEIERTYQAIVYGKLKDDVGTINQPIGRQPNSIIKRQVREDGQEAITHFTVLERTENKSKVKINLETGRTHQIRVHFETMGHPLVGDDLYDGEHAGMNRQALHCSCIAFHHPYSGEKVQIKAPIPLDMKELMTES